MKTSGKPSCAPSSRGSQIEAGAVYGRIRALLCRSWGIPPWEFDKAAQAEQVSFADAAQTLRLEAVETPLMAYLFPEREARRREKFNEVSGLLRRYERETDPAKREALGKQIEEANRW